MSVVDRGDVKSMLDRAREHLEANDDVGALNELLNAWRSRRAPVIADLIDRVSVRITATHSGGPVTAKTVKLRTEKWMELSKKRAPEDLGSLLSTPWPGTWMAAKPLIDMLATFPDDPRIAMALARMVESALYSSQRCASFYRPLFGRLNELRDARTLPVLLPKATARAKPFYWQARVGPLQTETVAKLRAAYADGPPALALGEEEEALAAIGALFSDAIGAEKAKARGEADFLEAIYEAPDDDGLRQVFADWLAERGDPHGELITIQLARRAGRDTEAMRKREASLLKKHAKAWVGELDAILVPEHRVFERGFLAEAMLQLPDRPTSPPRTLSDPAWATLHTLALNRVATDLNLTEAILGLHSLRWVHTFRGLREESIRRLAEGPALPRWLELDFHVSLDIDKEARWRIGDGRAFPSVTRLTLSFDGEVAGSIAWMLDTPLAKRATRITVRDYDYRLGEVVQLVEQLELPSLDEVCVTTRHLPQSGAVWLFTATKDERGRFTRLRGDPIGASTIPSRYILDKVLETFRPQELTELIIPPQRACTYDESDITALEQRFATLAGGPARQLQRIEVPWQRVKSVATNAKPLTIELVTPGVRATATAPNGAEYVVRLFELLADPPLALSFDAYAINLRGKHTSLPTPAANAAKKVAALLGKEHTTSLRLYRTGESATSELTITSHLISITSAWREESSGFVDAYLAWLVRVLDDAGAVVLQGRLPFLTDSGRAQVFRLAPFTYSPELGWITILNESVSAMLPFDEIERLAGISGLEWLRTVRSKHNIVLVVGTSPLTIPNEQMRNTLASALANVMWSGHRRLRGFVLPELVREVLGPPLSKHGFVELDIGPYARAQGEVHFVQRHGAGTRALHVTPIQPMGGMQLWIDRRQGPIDADLSKRAPREQRFSPTARDAAFMAHDAASARAALDYVVSRLDSEIIPWFSKGE